MNSMNFVDESPTTILIVDDAIENIEILNNILADHYRILFATSGADALSVAQEQRPDLILLDVVMPDMDGYDVCVQLKQNPLTQAIPVIFVTAKDQDLDEEKGLQHGAVDYLTKPIRPSIVLLRVGIHLELKRHRDFLARLSFTDGLTGIANRRRFDEFMELEWQRATRSAAPLSLILVDVDHFKAYNDHCGHAAGDQCLKTVAHTLASGLVRRTDLVARYGGEEFACVLPMTEHSGAIIAAQRLRQQMLALQLPHPQSSTGPFVTISLGVATFRPEIRLAQKTPRDLIEQADHCLYQAKKAGRNRVGHE